MRTFVFISNIPDFLLQPTRQFDESTAHLGAAAHAKAASRDPRYERLRRLLAEHSSGLMLVMHLETRGYGLALYASEEEALQACRTTILAKPPASHSSHTLPAPSHANETSPAETTNTPSSESHSRTAAALRLRILERERPAAPEAVYTPTITIEGEAVAKTDLALTRGLELAYRGRVVPRWCASTQQGEDCVFGISCHRIHRRVCQRTVRKRPRLDWLDAHLHRSGHSASAKMMDAADEQSRAEVSTARLLRSRPDYEAVLFGLDQSLGDAHRTDGDVADSLTNNTHTSSITTTNCINSVSQRGTLQSVGGVPHDMRLSPSVYVPIRTDELYTLLGLTASSPDARAALRQTLAARVREQCVHGGLSRPFFMRLSCPGGSPWDWSLYDDSDSSVSGSECDEDRPCIGDDAQNMTAPRSSRSHEAPVDSMTHACSRHDDATAKSSHSGWSRLRRRCPPPARGIPTPLERDLFIGRVLVAMNALNRFTRVSTALRALACSLRVRQAVLNEQQQQQQQQKQKQGNVSQQLLQQDSNSSVPSRPHDSWTAIRKHMGLSTSRDDGRLRADMSTSSVSPTSAPPNSAPSLTDSEPSTSSTASWYLCIHPWLRLPSPACEVSVFAEDGGQRVRAVVQRYGQQPILTPDALPVSMRQAESMLTNAAARLCRAVAQHRDGASETRLSHSLSRTAWCARLALVLPDTEESGRELCRAAKDEPQDQARAVVLSMRDYVSALETCPMHAHVTVSSQGDAGGVSAQESVSRVPAIVWNMQHHSHVPILDTNVLERLCMPME